MYLKVLWYWVREAMGKKSRSHVTCYFFNTSLRELMDQAQHLWMQLNHSFANGGQHMKDPLLLSLCFLMRPENMNDDICISWRFSSLRPPTNCATIARAEASRQLWSVTRQTEASLSSSSASAPVLHLWGVYEGNLITECKHLGSSILQRYFDDYTVFSV